MYVRLISSSTEHQSKPTTWSIWLAQFNFVKATSLGGRDIACHTVGDTRVSTLQDHVIPHFHTAILGPLPSLARPPILRLLKCDTLHKGETLCNIRQHLRAMVAVVPAIT